MKAVKIGIAGLGTVGGGALAILAENRAQIAEKLGFPLEPVAVCDKALDPRKIPAGAAGVRRYTDWREMMADAEVDIVAELVGGTGVARQIQEGAIAAGKSVVTANKELIALAGPQLWEAAARQGVSLAMEASVCGGIPIHNVLREGINADRVQTLFGILNGTSNYILTEVEAHGKDFAAVLAEAQRLGYAEADPTADVEGLDARSKLAILSALSFGVSVAPGSIHTEGIRRVTPLDFHYAHDLGCTIRLLCAARQADGGLYLSVRPSLLPSETILASVKGSYNAVWVKGEFGSDTFYYGRGAGSLPTGVAVVSDMMRIARDLRTGVRPRRSPYGFTALAPLTPLPIGQQRHPWYLRFRVTDRPGIIAALSRILADLHISLDAVIQLPAADKQDLPFVITLESTPEAAVRQALQQMEGLPFLVEPPLAMPIESGL